MSAIFARSDGCKANEPNENQLCAPWEALPRMNKLSKRPVDPRNNATDVHVERKKRTSTKLIPKNTAIEMASAISW